MTEKEKRKDDLARIRAAIDALVDLPWDDADRKIIQDAIDDLIKRAAFMERVLARR